MAKPIVAIVGRPNVGKSTFFNRLIGESLAIVEDEPGTTRDRLYGDTDWGGVYFTVVDTAGLEIEPGDENIAHASNDDLSPEERKLILDEITRRTREQAAQAIEEADVILFMVDAKSGLTSTDQELADILRRSEKPVFVVANKADNNERQQNAVEFYQLGLGDPIAISAFHGINTGDLLDLVIAKLPPQAEEEEEEGTHIAIVGRPNVGKSRLLNAIIGQERVIVSDIPGTTRDAIDTVLEWNDQHVTLIDTAGIRRRGRIEQGIEKYSVIRTVRAINRADVVLLVIDANEGLTAQDQHIAGYVLEANKSMVLIVNKWDLVEKDSDTMKEYAADLQQQLNFISYVPMVFISAKFGQRVVKVLPIAMQIAAERRKRISTGQLNKLVRDAVAEHNPPSRPGKWLKFYYATQADINPPTFVFFVNDAEAVHFSYRRYLENRIREAFGFEGTPLKMVFRNREQEDK